MPDSSASACEVSVTGEDMSSLLSQSVFAEGQEEKDRLPTATGGNDWQRSQTCSAFVVATVTPAGAAEVVHPFRSSTDPPEEHGQGSGKQPGVPADGVLVASVSSPAVDVSAGCTYEQLLQLRDVEPDGNNNMRFDAAKQSDVCAAVQQSTEATDDASTSMTRLDCVVTSQVATAAVVTTQSDAEVGCVLEEWCGGDSVFPATVLIEVGGSSATSLLGGEFLVAADSSMLDSVQQLSQSSADRWQFEILPSGGETQRRDSAAGQSESPAVVLDESLAFCDIDIPEIPVFQCRAPTSSALPSENSWLVGQDAGTADDAGCTYGTPAADTEATETVTVLAPMQATGGDESTVHAALALCPPAEVDDADVDVCGPGSGGEISVDASFGPLDLTCNRGRSANDTCAECNTTDLSRQDVVSKTALNHTICVPTNVYNYHAPHTDCCSRWSMVHTAGGYGVGWPPHPHPCYGHPGPFPHATHSPVLPGPQWPCCGAHQLPGQSRSRGTRPRRKPPAPYSCSRVDGIRSTKVPPSGESVTKEPAPATSSSSVLAGGALTSTHSVTPADTVAGAEVCVSSGAGNARTSSTSSVSTAVSDHVAAELGSGPPTSGSSDVNSNTDQRNVGESSATAEPVTTTPASRGRGGQRRGRTQRSARSRSSVKQQDGGSQPVVRGRPRGRPRKHPVRDGAASDRASAAAGEVGQQKAGSSDGKVERPAGRGGRHQGQRRLPAGRRLPDRASQAVGERCETLNIEDMTAPAPSQSDFDGAAAGNDYVSSRCSGTMTSTTQTERHSASCRSAPSPIATAGSIIRKPRSRKQGRQSRPTTDDAASSATGTDPVLSGVGVGCETPVSWQPLVSESAISSLLDTFSVAACDHELATPSLTASDNSRIQTSASSPFVMLERADLNRQVIHRHNDFDTLASRCSVVRI